MTEKQRKQYEIVIAKEQASESRKVGCGLFLCLAFFVILGTVLIKLIF